MLSRKIRVNMDVQGRQRVKSANGRIRVAHFIFVILKKVRIIFIVKSHGVKLILPHQVAGTHLLSVHRLVKMVILKIVTKVFAMIIQHLNGAQKYFAIKLKMLINMDAPYQLLSKIVFGTTIARMNSAKLTE